MSDKRKIRTKKKIIIILILSVLVIGAGIGIAIGIRLRTDIRYRMLQSVLNMEKNTLSSREYILNDIDVQKLCRDYMNGDVSIDGSVGLSNIEGYRFSINVPVKGERSFEQKRLSFDSTVKVLRVEVGDINMYGEGERLFFEAPILGDMAFAFDTGMDMFPKAPDMTSDLDSEWFKENNKNIREFMQAIEIKENGSTIRDEDGTVSEGYDITIPQGEGQFMWELMGMETPDKPIEYTVYITKKNEIRRITMDLSDTFDHGYIVIDGLNMGTVEFTCNMPDNEFLKIKAVRNPEYTRRIDIELDYDTREGKEYSIETSFEWMNYEDESGFECKARGIKILCDGEKLASGSFKGDVKIENNLQDVFEGRGPYLTGLEEWTWEEIRDSVEDFVYEVLDKLSIF